MISICRMLLIIVLFLLVITQSIITPCFYNETEVIIKHNNTLYIDLVDQSWNDYILEVYGNDTKSNPFTTISKNKINFIYKNTDTQVIPFYWPLSLIKQSSIKILEYVLFYNLQHSYLSNSWIEISRFSSHYIWSRFYEGYYHPQWNDYLNSNHRYVKVNYGVWFYLSKGSGIWVNLKRTMTIPTRKHLHMYFKNVNTNNCIHGDNGEYCHDKYLCTLVIREGYDSIQVLELHEVIICYGHHSIVNTACPPNDIELRKGYQPNELCICSNQSVLLNCVGQLQSSILDAGMFANHSKGSFANININTTSQLINKSTYYRPKTCINHKINQQYFNNNSNNNSYTSSMFKYKVLQNISLILITNQTNFTNNYNSIYTKYHNPLVISINFDINKLQIELINQNIISRIIDLNNDKQPIYKSYQHQLVLKYNQSNVKSVLIETHYNNEIISIMAMNHIIKNRLVGNVIREIIDHSLCLRTLRSKFIILVLRLQSYKKLNKLQVKYLYGYIDLIIIIYDNNNNKGIILNDQNKTNKCHNEIVNNNYMNYDEFITLNHSSTKVTPIIMFPYLSNKIRTISVTNRMYITNIIMNSYLITD